ncbi:MAG TPA: sugar ABC transporter permease, partial [Anaerolineae bacterium]|nr:sugar ABC transporter permease [Anaerolineae bacterium]
SLYKTAFLGLKKIYVGLENYGELLTSSDYQHSVVVSLAFSFGVTLLGMAISLAIALLANQKVTGARIYRMALIWPYALSPAVSGAIWLFLFNPTAGVVNYFTSTLFGVKPDWVTVGPLALFMVTAAAVWNQLGYNIVFFLAGLQNLPGDILEAAEVDGANAWHKFWKVTLPLLSPIAFFLLVMNLIYSFFGTFGMVDVMTKGGPADATNILIYNLYKDAFQNYKSGFAAAQSVILLLIVTGLTLLQFRTTGRRVHYGA